MSTGHGGWKEDILGDRAEQQVGEAGACRGCSRDRSALSDLAARRDIGDGDRTTRTSVRG